jgi:hypothetical protein
MFKIATVSKQTGVVDYLVGLDGKHMTWPTELSATLQIHYLLLTAGYTNYNKPPVSFDYVIEPV